MWFELWSVVALSLIMGLHLCVANRLWVTMPDELIGQQVGGYEVLDRVGQGGMAAVYRAKQNSMNRTVALKVLPRHHVRDDTYLKRFEREVEIIAQLEHRNIVPVYDYGEYDNLPFIAMRYMPAGSVDDLLSRGTLKVERALDIVQQIAPALDYAHSKNVLHRDLKPSNILLDDNGDAYLTDFGIARILGVESKGNTITTQGVVGTPSYMSPEQAQGKDLDGRSDLYSLGVALFEMLTGRRPFENETPYGIAVMQVTAQPPNPRSFNPQLTAAVEQVILKALKKKPDNRYNNAVEMAQAFTMAVERPDSIYDTEPSGIPTNLARQSTQPAQPQQYEEERTVPSSPAPQSAVHNTPPPAYNTPSAYVPPPQSSQMQRPVGLRDRVRRERQRRGNNLWFSVLVGMIIGCGLLSLLVVVLIMTLDSLFDTGGNDDTQAAVTVPTLDPTERALRALLGSGGSTSVPGETPQFTGATAIPTRAPTEGVAPVGVAATPTLDPAFDPTQSRILYFAQRGDGNYAVYTYDLSTGREIRLTGEGFDSSYPLASPDGAQIVYQSNEEGDFEIYVMDLDDRDTRQLTDNTVTDRLAAWSPDGEWIVYSSDVRGDDTYDLYRVRPDGSDREVIYAAAGRSSHARFSSDGRSLVFTDGNPNDATTWEVVRFVLAEGEIEPLTDNVVQDHSPSFSPDDAQIVYVTTGDGGGAIALMDDDGRNRRIIYDSEHDDWGASYSPDGGAILFNTVEEASGQIYVMEADGDNPRLIDNGGGFYPSWLP